jgi:uncharacterized caspase-like protein
LKYSEGDAVKLAQALQAGGFARRDIVVMTTAREAGHRLSPRAENIRSELKALARRCTENDIVLVAFAGYERQFRDTDGYYLCPTDADPTDRETLVALSDLYGTLATCKAGTKVVLIDSCRGRERAEGGQKEPPAGVAVFFATSATEIAYEDDTVHGVFTHFVAEGLRGAAEADKDGAVTLAELERYVRPRVVKYSGSKFKAKQRPELIGQAPTTSLVSVPRRLTGSGSVCGRPRRPDGPAEPLSRSPGFPGWARPPFVSRARTPRRSMWTNGLTEGWQ